MTAAETKVVAKKRKKEKNKEKKNTHKIDYLFIYTESVFLFHWQT